MSLFLFPLDSGRYIFQNYRVILWESEWISQLTICAKCPHWFLWFSILSLGFPELDCLQRWKNDFQHLTGPYEHMTILFSNLYLQCHLGRESFPISISRAGPTSWLPSDPTEWSSLPGCLLCIGWSTNKVKLDTLNNPAIWWRLGLPFRKVWVVSVHCSQWPNRFMHMMP